MQGLYINLDRAENRRRRLQAELARFGLVDQYRRVRGIADDEAWRGCWKSHIKALTEAKRIGGIVHIIEDDVILSDRVGPLLASQYMADLLARFDIVYLSMWVDPDPVSRQTYTDAMNAAGDGHAIIDMRTTRIGSADSYVVAPRSIDKILRLMSERITKPPPTAYDAYTNRKAKDGTLTAATLVPIPHMHRSGDGRALLHSADDYRRAGALREAENRIFR